MGFSSDLEEPHYWITRPMVEQRDFLLSFFCFRQIDIVIYRFIAGARTDFYQR
jgi:hypothetical protein